MPVAVKAVEHVKIPEKVEVDFDPNNTFTVQGPNGKLTRKLSHPSVKITRESGDIVFTCDLPKKKDKAMVRTFASHLINMCKGVTGGFQYTMKTVYSHFPIKATLKGKALIIENFMGEKKPRSAKILGDTKVLVKGNDITLIGPNIEEVGQTAANIERATKIRKRDPRVFQDGIYIVDRKG
jgi:large subunit ribosomal protein L6